MKWYFIIAIVLLEFVALFAIIRVWRQKRRRVVAKLLWSALLAVPVFGLMFYCFLTINPEAREDHTEDSIGADGGV